MQTAISIFKNSMGYYYYYFIVVVLTILLNPKIPSKSNHIFYLLLLQSLHHYLSASNFLLFPEKHNPVNKSIPEEGIFHGSLNLPVEDFASVVSIEHSS